MKRTKTATVVYNVVFGYAKPLVRKMHPTKTFCKADEQGSYGQKMGENDDIHRTTNTLQPTFKEKRGNKVKHVLGIFLLVMVMVLTSCDFLTAPVDCNINVGADALEPNDTPEQATFLSTTELTGTFKENDKPDYFTVTGSAGDVIALEKKFGVGDPTLSVKNADDKELEVKQTSATVQSVTLSASGTYLVQVGLKTTGDACADDVEYDLSFTPTSAPTPTLDSALGDSPTLTGTIQNLADVGATTGTLKLKAIAYGNDITDIAEGTVADDGSFSITLPGKSVMNALVAENPLLDGEACVPTTFTPNTTKGATLVLMLWDDVGELGGLLVFAPTVPNDFMSEARATASFSYLDTNSGLTGTLPKDCAGFVEPDTDLPVNVTLREGWNSLVIDKTEGFINKKLDSSFVWGVFPTRPPQNNTTISGTVQEYTGGEAGLEAQSLEKVSNGSINADGSFSVTLPETLGDLELTPASNAPCEGVTMTPASYKVARFYSLTVIKDGAVVGALAQAKVNPANGESSLVFRVYVDQDVRIIGTCPSNEVSYDISFQKGWNVMLLNEGNGSTSYTSPENVDLPWLFSAD